MKKIVFIVIVMVALAGVLVYPLSQGNEIESGFGSWKLEVYSVTEDGTETLMEPKMNNLQTLSWLNNNGDVVTAVKYVLKAKATGSGFDFCELDLDAIPCGGQMWKGSIWEWNHAFSTSYGPSSITIPLDNAFHNVFSKTFALPSTNDGAGSYDLYIFFGRANARFRGLSDGGNGDWQTESVDIKTYLDIEYTSGGGGGGSTEYDVSFVSTPDHADIILGGVTKTTPCTFYDLTANQEYGYTAMKDGYETVLGNVFVDADKTVSVDLTVIPSGYAELTVYTISVSLPCITIDGDSSTTICDRLAVFTLPLGSHTVKASNGLFTKTSSIDLQSDMSLYFDLTHAYMMVPLYDITMSTNPSSYVYGDKTLGT